MSWSEMILTMKIPYQPHFSTSHYYTQVLYVPTAQLHLHSITAKDRHSEVDKSMPRTSAVSAGIVELSPMADEPAIPPGREGDRRQRYQSGSEPRTRLLKKERLGLEQEDSMPQENTSNGEGRTQSR